MAMLFKRCVSDDDLANASLFFLKFKRDLHPSFSTIDAVTVLYLFMTQGYLVQITDGSHRVIGVSAYYHGTQEQEFKDKDIAFVDMAIIDISYRGTPLFVKGLRYLVSRIVEDHPEVREIRFSALAENDYLCRMYRKFTETSYSREGMAGEEKVFCVEINKLKTTLKKFDRV